MPDTAAVVVERLRSTAGRALGVGDATPYLTWTTRSVSASSAFRLQLAAEASFADVSYDTGELTGAGVWVAWPGPPLRSREKVHWRVQVLTEQGWSPWSASVLEAGLLLSQDWTALPIAGPAGLGVPVLSRAFVLPAEPVRGRLYVTALGVVEVTVNGAPVSEDLLSPGWSSYGNRLAYNTYDVTDLLRLGRNAVAATVGQGWYSERVALLAQLEVLLADGSTVVVGSDQSWSATSGPVRAADLVGGSSTDLTVELEVGEPAEVLDLDLRDRLYVRQGPPVRRTGSRLSADLGPTHDFGHRLTGWVRLRAAGPGSVTARYAQTLEDLPGATSVDSWAVPAGDHVLEPTFTFHSFRYCEVDGPVQAVEAIAVSAARERLAWFTCSDPQVEAQYEEAVAAEGSRTLGTPTEPGSLHWTRTAAAVVASSALLHDSRGWFADWLGDLRADQHQSGAVPAVVPGVRLEQDGDLAGGAAAAVVPWTVAERSADPRVLPDGLRSLQRWVDWVQGQLSGGLWLGDTPLLGWFENNPPPEFSEDRGVIANALFVRSTRTLGEALETCGLDGSHYALLSTLTAEKAWARWGSLPLRTAGGCALALRSGLVPGDERALVGQLLADLVAADSGLAVGLPGTEEVLFALSENGQLARAYALLPGLPSDQGGLAGWLHEVVAGLVVRELPSPELLVAPHPGGGLSWAQSRQLTPRGEALVRWDLEGDLLRVRAVVPAGYAARFEPPEGWNGTAGPIPEGNVSWLLTR